ncbi:hypothetical protein K8R66_03645, partial [bacterium]|nr:hypothetical protein [bacterium]
MKYILKTSKILINPENNPHQALIYTGSPKKNQKNKGKLIVLLDLPNETENKRELNNLLVQKIHRLYYESTLIDQETILENILEEVNENLPLITKVDKDWLKDIKAFITIVYRQEVYFSPLGKVSTWVTNNNQLVNIFDYLESDIDKPSIDRVFTNILSGNIEPNQTLILTTDTLFNYLTEEKLNKIISENDIAGVIINLRELLYKVKNKTFCFLATKLSPYNSENENTTRIEKIESLQAQNQVSAKESMDKLLNTGQKTEDILKKGKSQITESSEQIRSTENFNEKEKEKINNNELDKLISEKLEKETNQNPESKSDFTNPPKKQLNIPISKYSKKIIKFLKNILELILKILISPYQLLIILKNKISEKQNNIDKKLPTNAILGYRSKKQLSRKKIIIIFIITLVVALSISIYLTNKNKKTEEEKEKFIETIEKIDEKQTEYELLNIYNDEDQAKEKLEEISRLIKELPRNSSEQEAKYQEILNNFEEKLNKVRKLSTVKNLEIISELSFNPISINKYGNSLIISGQNSNELSLLNIKDQKIKNIGQEDQYNNINNFVKNGDILYALNNDNLFSFNLDDNQFSKLEIAFHSNYQNSKATTFYSDNLYILDADSNQIYKHTPLKNGFSKGNEWINDNTDLSSANSIAIDGNIYVAYNNGELKRLYAGSLNDLEIEDIDPIIENIDKIYTDKSIPEIYIMDNISKRIIIINKEGQLIKQYYFPTI